LVSVDLSIFEELKRRSVFRVVIGYVVSSWLLAQVADLVLENIGAPDWVMQTILLVLALGFPVVVFFSWAYEVTPDGIKLESEIDRSESFTHVTRRKLDRAIVAVLVIALAYFAYDKFVLDSSRDTELAQATTESATEQQDAAPVETSINLSESGVIRFIHHLAPMERIWRANLFDRSTVALSPDGTRLVYVARRDDGARQLYLLRLDQLEGKPIPGTENAHSPFFSPDGEWVAFFTPNELKRASLSTGAVVAVSDVIPASSGGSWGSDGNILFTFEPKEGLVTIPDNGGKPKPITESKGGLGHHFPHPLPGDKGLLFTIMQSEAWSHTGIAVLSFETGLWRTLLEEGTHPHYLSSGYVVYALAGTLQAVPFDLDRLEISGKPVQLLDGAATRFGADFSLAADGTLAYVPGDWGWPDRALVWVDRDGKIVDNTCQPRNYWWPRISPDGQRVAVTINSRRKGSTDIWICELARNNTLTRLTVDPAWDYFPIWTFDGKRVTYAATSQSTPDLIEIAADGTGAPEWLLRKRPGIWPASWSPDGSILLFTEEHPDTNFDIWMFPTDGGEAEPWLQTSAFEGKPVFSPDGRWVAFQSDESGQHEVFVGSFPNIGQKYRISTDGGTEPVWAADGEELFYRNGDKMMAVAVMTSREFSSAEPKLLFESKYSHSSAHSGASYDVASSGRFLMITESEQDLTQINVVINWAAEVKRLVSIDN
jgi:Tol biopolymer transport system component